MGDGLEQIPLIFHKLTTFRDNYVTRYLLTVDRKTLGWVCMASQPIMYPKLQATVEIRATSSAFSTPLSPAILHNSGFHVLQMRDPRAN